MVERSSDLSLMVEPLNYFSFQPVLDDWYNKGRGRPMWYSVCLMVHIKEPLLIIGKSNLVAAAGFFSLSLSIYIYTLSVIAVSSIFLAVLIRAVTQTSFYFSTDTFSHVGNYCEVRFGLPYFETSQIHYSGVGRCQKGRGGGGAHIHVIYVSSVKNHYKRVVFGYMVIY